MIGYGCKPKARTTACALMLLAASPCFASLQSPKDAPVALKYTVSCRVQADLSEDCAHTWRYDILTAAGRDLLSQVKLAPPENEAISQLDAYAIKRDGTRVRLPKSQIVRKSGAGPEQGIDNSTSTVLLFQGLEVGGAIEYSTRSHSKALRAQATFSVGTSIPPRGDSL